MDLAAFHFPADTLLLTGAGTRKRTSLHVVGDASAADQFRRGGIDVIEADLPSFIEALTRENHTLKRALTNPRLFDGIGGAYSDEVLHAAGLSPSRLSSKLEADEIERCFEAARDTLRSWSERLVGEARLAFTEKVTALRPGMAVHGRYGKPCSNCGTGVQGIVYASRETHYGPRCQAGGKILADRALSAARPNK